MRRIREARAQELTAFVQEAIEPGSVVCTDGWNGYRGLDALGYRHEFSFQKEDAMLLPRVHRVASLLKGRLLGTHPGAVSANTWTTIRMSTPFGSIAENRATEHNSFIGSHAASHGDRPIAISGLSEKGPTEEALYI